MVPGATDRDEQVNVFLVSGRYLFKHFFEDEVVYARLKQYYNNQQYRFEVPEPKFTKLQWFLATHGYTLTVQESTAEFVIVVKKYTDHPENIFKQSVMQRSQGEYNCFLMTDRDAVRDAEQAGATPLTATPLANPFETEPTTDEATS